MRFMGKVTFPGRGLLRVPVVTPDGENQIIQYISWITVEAVFLIMLQGLGNLCQNPLAQHPPPTKVIGSQTIKNNQTVHRCNVNHITAGMSLRHPLGGRYCRLGRR